MYILHLSSTIYVKKYMFQIGIVWEYWPDTSEFIIQSFKLGGLDCRVITTEFISHVHGIHVTPIL